MKRPGPPVSRRQFVALAGVGALAGCLGSTADEKQLETPRIVQDDYTHPRPSDSPDWDAPESSPRVDVEVETLVENLEIPWDIAFTGTGEMFMTERTGQILRFDSGEVSEVTRPRDAIDAGSIAPGSDEQPWWVDGGEGGTLGIEVHPEYPDEEWVYVYYTASVEDDGKENRVVRFDVGTNDPASTEEILVEGIPADSIHNGGRIRFGPDGNLWICCGDAGERADAQDTSSLAGSILRITPDGRIPSSNPELDGDRRIFTYGHRNPQGIDWLPSGVPISSEFGPTNRDEVNLLFPGDNYGWPEVRGGPEDPSDNFGSYPAAGVTPPLVNTGPDGGWAPTGATFYTGEDLPAWRNRFVIGGLISQAIWVVTLTPPGEDPPPLDGESKRYDGDWTHGAFTATAHRMLENELGRVRHVAQSPTGELYAITSNRDGRAEQPFPREKDDVLVRLTPA